MKTMNDRIDRGGPSSTSAPSGPLAEAGPGASSRPPGPAQRPSAASTARTRRIGLATGSLAALGTLALALVAVSGLPSPATGRATAAAMTAAVTPVPTEQVVVDTVYVQAPAPTADPDPIVVAAPAQAAQPPVRIVRVVASQGGEHEGDEDDHDGEGEPGGDD
jgi:hypothetical protein